MLIRLMTVAALLGVFGAACASAPPYAGWTDDQLFEHAQQAFEAEEWEEARRAFERLILTFPGFDRVVDARHYLARSFFAEREFVSAVAEFTRIVQVFPDHERTPAAWMGLCRAYASMSPHPQRDSQYTIQARTTCRNVAEDFRGTPQGDSAATVAQDMHNKLGDKAYQEGHFYLQRDILVSAEHVFLNVLDAYPDTDAAPQALARLVEIYEEWEWEDQIVEFRQRLLTGYPDSPQARNLLQAAVDSVGPVGGRVPIP